MNVCQVQRRRHGTRRGEFGGRKRLGLTLCAGRRSCRGRRRFEFVAYQRRVGEFQRDEAVGREGAGRHGRAAAAIAVAAVRWMMVRRVGRDVEIGGCRRFGSVIQRRWCRHCNRRSRHHCRSTSAHATAELLQTPQRQHQDATGHDAAKVVRVEMEDGSRGRVPGRSTATFGARHDKSGDSGRDTHGLLPRAQKRWLLAKSHIVGRGSTRLQHSAAPGRNGGGLGGAGL
jgi:hypothetical protein